MKRLLLWLLCPSLVMAQTASVNWTSQKQQLNGFGASDESQGGSMTSANQQFFFGLGNGQLGLSILRVGLTTGISGGSQDPGNCASVSASCAGVYTSDMQAILAVSPTNLIYASPWTPPAIYKSNGTVVCSPGGGVLSNYSGFATWITNFVQSLKTQVSPSIPLYAVSIQNEPDICPTYNGATYSAANIDTFIKSNLGPAFSSAGITTKILTPETSNYSNVSGYGGTCVGDSGCATFLGGYQWHDYDASLSGGVPPVSPDPVPAGWATSGKLWWETEASQGNDYGPACGSYSAFTATIADGLCWGAIIDQRMQDGANAWNYWQFMDYGGSAPATIQNGSLMSNAAAGSVVAKRAFVLGQYAKFVRPGDVRIDATHVPQSNVTVSAYQNTGTNTIKIILTNYSGSTVSQPVSITNAPTFTTLTPTQTSASNSLVTLPNVSVSGNSFTYSLPPQSITTFVGTASSGGGPLWAGLLNTNRAPPGNPWSSAGAGAIPARSGTACQTLGTAGQSPSFAQSVTAANIVTALQACANSNSYVYMNPGTYTMTTTIFGPGNGGTTPSNVTLRGSGPQQTILAWTSMTNTCLGVGLVGLCGYNGDSGTGPFADNVLQVTSGVTQGSTSVVLGTPASSGCYGGAACSGNISNLKVGSLMQFTQCATGFSGVGCTGTSTDNGNFYDCGEPPPSSGTAYCTWSGSDDDFNWNREQTQTVLVTGISGNTVTFTPALYLPNWTQSLSPFASFSNYLPIVGFGLENIQLNTQQMGDNEAMLQYMWCYHCWVKNVAAVNAAPSGTGLASRTHFNISSGLNNTVRDSYMYGSSPGSSAYGVDLDWGETNSLVENNIAHHMASAFMTENAVGSVFGYNYDADNYYVNGDGNWQQCELYHHDAGDAFQLYEGHEGICFDNDDIHGTSFGETAFRNYLSGHDSATLCPGGGTGCGTLTKLQNTAAILDLAFARYENVALNVLGDSVYANTYQNVGVQGSPNTCSSYPWTILYSLNFANGNQLPFSPACVGSTYTLDNDALTSQTMMRWGNYDTVNGSVQTNSSETGSGAPVYPGLSSPSTAWSAYPSLYLTSKPSFLGSLPWPGIGPDVTGGNISGVSGHANHNAAGNCYRNVLGGQVNGSSGPLPFDANNCYTAGPPTANAPTFSPASPYSGAATTVTASTSTSPCNSYIYFGTANPPTVNTSTYSFAATVTLYAYVHNCPGYADSPVETWSGTSATPGLAAPTFSPTGSVDAATAPYFLSNPTITMTCPAGATCGYTIDGSTPTASSGTITHGTTYSAPFSLTISTAGVALKAIASQSGSTNSAVTTQTYIERNAVLDTCTTCSFNGGNAAVTTGTITPSPSPSSGDGVSLGYAIGNNTATATFTDNFGGVYVTANPSCYGNSQSPAALTYAASGRVYRTTPWPGGSGTITMTFSVASQYSGFGAEFWKPATAGNFVLDTTFTSAYTQPCVTGTTANPAAASHTPTNANEIVYGQVLTYVQVPTAGSGFMLVNPLPGGPNIYPEYQIQSTATATTLPYNMSADQWQLQPAAGFFFVPTPPGTPTGVQGVIIYPGSGDSIQ